MPTLTKITNNTTINAPQNNSGDLNLADHRCLLSPIHIHPKCPAAPPLSIYAKSAPTTLTPPWAQQPSTLCSGRQPPTNIDRSRGAARDSGRSDDSVIVLRPQNCARDFFSVPINSFALGDSGIFTCWMVNLVGLHTAKSRTTKPATITWVTTPAYQTSNYFLVIAILSSDARA